MIKTFLRSVLVGLSVFVAGSLSFGLNVHADEVKPELIEFSFVDLQESYQIGDTLSMKLEIEDESEIESGYVSFRNEENKQYAIIFAEGVTTNNGDDTHTVELDFEIPEDAPDSVFPLYSVSIEDAEKNSKTYHEMADEVIAGYAFAIGDASVEVDDAEADDDADAEKSETVEAAEEVDEDISATDEDTDDKSDGLNLMFIGVIVIFVIGLIVLFVGVSRKKK